MYSVDLCGYGTHQFPERDIMFISGWSDKIFDIMSMMESGESLVKTIENYEIQEIQMD